MLLTIIRLHIDVPKLWYSILSLINLQVGMSICNQLNRTTLIDLITKIISLCNSLSAFSKRKILSFGKFQTVKITKSIFAILMSFYHFEQFPKSKFFIKIMPKKYVPMSYLSIENITKDELQRLLKQISNFRWIIQL